MNKAKEISALWEQIKTQIGELVGLCCEVKDHAEVTADAYQRGYENGFIAGHLKAEKSGQSFYEDGYQCGLNDAWGAARKICTNWVLPDSVLSKIFGMDKTIDDIMKENKASEAIEKIRQYEQEQEKDRQARIKYNFDEIKDVLETTAKERNVSLDEIAEVLAKMKETDNG